jgi:hypothetical protein
MRMANVVLAMIDVTLMLMGSIAHLAPDAVAREADRPVGDGAAAGDRLRVG